MCGRFTLTAEMRAIAERFGVNYPRGFAGMGTDTQVAASSPRYNIAADPDRDRRE
jgi:putative SOS response-associated peptidase YedK